MFNQAWANVRQQLRAKLKPVWEGSLYQWMLGSFVVVSLPLMFAIVYALVSMDSYSKQAHKTVFQTVMVTENSRLILERLVSMERSIRQYQVLKETSLLDAFLTHHQKFISLMDASKPYDIDSDLAKKLNQLKQLEMELFESVYHRAFQEQKPVLAEDVGQFEILTNQAKQIIEMGSRQQSLEVQALSEYEGLVRERVFYIVLASALLAFLLSVVFVHFITKPIRKTGSVIRRLAKDDFETPIEISAGPRDLRELGGNLEGLRQELKHLENEKQQFIRNISHELKTPLATLKEGTDLLSEELIGSLTQEQKEVVQLMQVGNFNIMNLVANLLEYQKAVSIQSRLDLGEVDVSKLVAHLVADYQLLVQNKGVVLDVAVPRFKIVADAAKLKMILSNFLSNAIKFSNSGDHIGVSVTRTQTGLHFLVEDQGPGIPEELHQAIFEDFFQGDVQPGSTMKGTGLGLAIVGYYVDKHGGEIQLLPPNKYYSGARIALDLPVEPMK